MGVEEIIGIVFIDGVKYLVKRGIDAAGRAIKKFFRDDNDDGVPDSETEEFWEYDGEITDTAEYYEELQDECNERWEYFSEAVYSDVPDFISSQFKQFSKNPLCVTITVSLLVAAAFSLACKLFRFFRLGI